MTVLLSDWVLVGSSSLVGFCRYRSHYLSSGFDRSLGGVVVAVGVSLVGAFEHFEYGFGFFFFGGYRCCSGGVGGNFFPLFRGVLLL